MSAKTKGIKLKDRFEGLTWSTARVAHLAVGMGAQAAQELPVLVVGALPAGLLARATLLRRKPDQLEPLLKHVPVSAASEVGPVPCHHHQNIAPHRHGEVVLAVRGQLLLLGFAMIIRCQHEGRSSIPERTLQPVAVDSERVQSRRRGIATEEGR